MPAVATKYFRFLSPLFNNGLSEIFIDTKSVHLVSLKISEASKVSIWPR